MLLETAAARVQRVLAETGDRAIAGACVERNGLGLTVSRFQPDGAMPARGGGRFESGKHGARQPASAKLRTHVHPLHFHHAVADGPDGAAYHSLAFNPPDEKNAAELDESVGIDSVNRHPGISHEQFAIESGDQRGGFGFGGVDSVQLQVRRHRIQNSPGSETGSRVVACLTMKGQLKVSTPEEYLAQLDEPRKSDVAALDGLIRKTAPKLAPFIHSGMLAYGPYHYKYESGREGDGFRIGLSSNQNYISLYVASGAERYKEALPKASIGKSCVRFKRLSDLDQAALRKMLREAAKAPAKS